MTVYGVAEIAAALDADRHTVAKWAERGSHGMPAPDERLACGPIWHATTIEPWIRGRRGR